MDFDLSTGLPRHSSMPEGFQWRPDLKSEYYPRPYGDYGSADVGYDHPLAYGFGDVGDMGDIGEVGQVVVPTPAPDSILQLSSFISQSWVLLAIVGVGLFLVFRRSAKGKEE